ncbi:MAG: class I SAM-dependent methyltransferase [Acidimicrobiales bacterium]
MRSSWDERHRTALPAEPASPIGWEEAGLSPPRSGRVLDVACGTGPVSLWFAGHGLDVVALDASPVAIEAVAAQATEHGVRDRMDARVHDLEPGLPPALGEFEVVVCQRYRDPELVPSLLRHLTADGVAVLSVLSEVGADRPGRHHAPSGELREAVDQPGFIVRYHRESDGLAVVVAQRNPDV